MTYGDVMAQILSEVTGKSKKEVESLLNIIKERFPGEHKMDEELPDEKAEKLLNDLRKEKSGILAWIVKGAIDVGRHEGHA